MDNHLVRPFTERATPDPLFFRGLGFGFLATGVLGAGLLALVHYLF
ncbi:MAG TPA: hypothetical protein VNR59_14100 [Gaiellaceae bacterium]|nr:hypothetical protein [Gaiellaceae bacterium]